jgi:hypothetical protein
MCIGNVMIIAFMWHIEHSKFTLCPSVHEIICQKFYALSRRHRYNGKETNHN